MNRSVLVIIALFFFIGLNAQNTVYGKVVGDNNEILIGATVFFPEIGKGTVTNDKGEYYISDLPDGVLKIEFSYIGYNTKIFSIEISSEKKLLDVELVSQILETHEIVVTGGYISSQHENAVKIDVLKIEDIRLSGTANFTEALTQIPGVDMISKGQGISKPVIRGLSMNDILIMNNGVRIENYQYSENHPMGVDGNSIKKVEIIKGPASLLYGSDAIGGVINFIKESPAPVGKIIGDFNSQLFSGTKGINTNLGIKGYKKNMFGGVRIGIKSHADYLQGGGEYVPNSRFSEKTINVNTGYTGSVGSFKLYYDYFGQNLGLSVPPVRDLIDGQGRKNEYWFQELDHHLISSQNSIYLGSYKLGVNIAYQKALRKLNTVLDVPIIEMNLNTITYESKLYLPVNKKSEYIFGLQGMSQTNRNLNDRIDKILPDANINNVGLLGLAKFTFLNKLKLQGGVRYDLYKTETFALGMEGTSDYHTPVNKNFSSFSGSIGATFRANDNILFRSNLAKAYRVPNISELTSNGMHGTRYEIGNGNLSPEKALEFDLSMHYHIDYLTMDLGGFYNQINDYIFISPTSDTTMNGVDIFRYSQNNANLFGGEGGFHFHPNSLSWFHMQGTYSYVIGKQEDGEYLPFIPAQKIRYEIKVEKEKFGFLKSPAIKLSVLTALEQNNPSRFESKTNSYSLVNIGFNTKFEFSNQEMIFAFSVNNVFDKQYYDHLSTLKSIGYYNQGRNISLMLKIPFEIN